VLAGADDMLLPVANIIIHEGPSTLEFLGSLGVAGLLAPLLAAWQSRSADRRRFSHERKLHATGDLIERIEAVLTSLEDSGEKCAEMRQMYLSVLASEPEKLWPCVLAAEDAYQRLRVAIARLRMRPHAEADMLDKAEAAAAKLLAAVHTVRAHLIRRRTALAATGNEPLDPPIEPFIEDIDEGYRLTREYAAQARVAIGRLQEPVD
jgi:hypothetical protein